MSRITYRARTACLASLLSAAMLVTVGADRLSADPHSYGPRSYGPATLSTTVRGLSTSTAAARYDAALRRPGDAIFYGVTSPYVRYYSYGYGARRWPYHAWYSYPYARSNRYSFYGLNGYYGSYGPGYGLYRPWYSYYGPGFGYYGLPYPAGSGLTLFRSPALPAAVPGRHYGGCYYW